jgi:5'-3' exonuclease
LALKKIALVDTDVLVYWTSFACQKNHYVYQGIVYPDYNTLREHLKEKGLKPGEVEYDKHTDILEERAFYSIAKRAEDMIRNTVMPDRLYHFISGDTNFRTEVATIQEYKGNRKDVDKPHYFDLAKDYWKAKAYRVSDNEEADDLLGIAATATREAGHDPIICSIDKDLNMIPSKHYNWDKALKYQVGHDDADRWFWLQTLMGDKADNIPGIKGYGPAKAEKALENCNGLQSRRDAVLTIYKKQWGQMHEDVLNEVGKLLWIRRKPDQMWSIDKHEELSV